MLLAARGGRVSDLRLDRGDNHADGGDRPRTPSAEYDQDEWLCATLERNHVLALDLHNVCDRDQTMTTATASASATEKSIGELRRQSERNREALAATVGELRERVGDTATELKTLVSPSHIKKEIRHYVRQERRGLVDAVSRKARENPLQVAAVAAAIAYPALGLLRALPAPLWLIGAGLFLTSKRGRQVAEDVKARVDNSVQQGTEKVADLASSVRSDLEDRIAGARYRAEEVSDAVTSTVGGMADKAKAAFQDASSSVTAALEASTPNAAAAADRMRSSVSEFGNAAIERADQKVRTAREAVTDFVNDNPLLVAGIVATLGAVIAASIPPSDAENKLFGAGSEKLKDKARDVAAQGLEKVGDIATNTAGAVAAAAVRQGLDEAGVQSALNKVADSVRAVADRGVDKALGNSRTTPTDQKPFEQFPAERNLS